MIKGTERLDFTKKSRTNSTWVVRDNTLDYKILIYFKIFRFKYVKRDWNYHKILDKVCLIFKSQF